MKTNIHFYHTSLIYSQNEKYMRQNLQRKSKHTFVSNNLFFFLENRAFYEIMGKNIAERGRTQMTIWRMRIACWIRMATDTHSEYVIFIVFPLQQQLKENASMLRLYVHCLSFFFMSAFLRSSTSHCFTSGNLSFACFLIVPNL